MKIFKSQHVARRNFVIKIDMRGYSWKILFFGSDAFSLFSLKELHRVLKQKTHVSSLDVVTNVASKGNPVKKFADSNSLSICGWPPDLETQEKSYDIGVVVSFGHLIPKRIISHFPLGMINVHASLLPRWRGASPIVHSILNGDLETGVSIMRIDPYHFDTGNIILQKSCPIGPDELMPSLYERLGNLGANALGETITTLPDCLEKSTPQSSDQVSYAPRIKADIALVQWKEQTSQEVYNRYRALFSVYDLKTTWHDVPVKLKKLKVTSDERDVPLKPGQIEWHRSVKQVSVRCKTGSVVIDSLSIGGKSLRGIDFFNGYLSKRPVTDWFFE